MGAPMNMSVSVVFSHCPKGWEGLEYPSSALLPDGFPGKSLNFLSCTNSPALQISEMDGQKPGNPIIIYQFITFQCNCKQS